MTRTLIASDDFNRAGPALGGNWTSQNAANAGDPQIVASTKAGGQYTTQLVADIATAFWSGVGSFTADQYAKAAILTPLDSNSARTSVTVRASGASSGTRTYYELVVKQDSVTTPTTELVKWVGNTRTVLATTTMAWAVNDTLELEVTGASPAVLRCYKSGAAIAALNYSDSTSPITTGAPGFGASSPAFLDNWEGGNLTAATPPTLSAQTGVPTGPTQGTAGATTDTATGAAYLLPRVGGSVAAAAAIKAGGVRKAISSAAAFTQALTGLTTNVANAVDIVHDGDDAGTFSNVVTATLTPNTLAIAGTALSAQTGVQGSALSWTGATPDSLISNHGNGSGSWSVTAGVGASGVTGCNASTGVPTAATLGTPGSYTITLTYTDGSTVPTAQSVTKTFGLTISPSGDATRPTLVGSVTPSNIAATTATISWPAGSDNVGVVGYDYSLDGSTWVQLGNVLTYGLTGLTPSTAYTCYVRARDAAGNTSTPAISGSFTTAALGSLATSVPITLTTDGATPAAGVTGLRWAFFDEPRVDLLTTAVARGTGVALNSNGHADLDITGLTTLAPGKLGYLIIGNGDGTLTQDPDPLEFSGTVQVA